MKRLSAVTITFVVIAGLSAACSPAADKSTSPTVTAEVVAASPDGPAEPQGFTGTVVETMDAARYTYLLVDTGSEKIWVAATQFPVAVGDKVSVPAGTPMRDFHSSVLDRTFPVVYFVSAVTTGDDTTPATAATDAKMVPHSGAPVVGREVSSAVAAAPGGLTVAAIHGGAKDMAGKTVTVRGRVVKANMGIMGANWYHVQDGSGLEAEGTHDLTVTSQDTAAVGDVVTFTGLVAIDKDFGFGYQYPVIVENASITK